MNGIFTSHICGMDRDESDRLLGHLLHQAEYPEYQCRVRWKKDSVAFWDNRATWHFAQNDYPGERRVMHRITLDGCALEAA